MYILVCKGKDYAATEDKKKNLYGTDFSDCQTVYFMNLNGITSHDSKNIAIEKAC